MAVEIRSHGEIDRLESTPAETWQLVAAGTLLVGGVFSDGWAHSNVVDELESFITPWHLVIFAGFLACLAVITRASLRRVTSGHPIWSAAPVGWSSAVWGIGLFGLGFLGDGIWHTIYGIEANFEALMSPTHLMMLTGALAVLAAPIAATPRRGDVSLRPVLAASTLFMSLVSFFLVWIWPPSHGVATDGYQEFIGRFGEWSGFVEDSGEGTGVAGYLLFTIAAIAPILFLGRRWKLPAGSVLLITVVPWLGLTVAFLTGGGIERVPAIVLAAIAGESVLYFGDTRHRRTWITFGVAMPAVWVAFDMLAIDLFYGIGWAPELVAGSVVLSALAGAGVALLATHPEPVAAD